MDDVPDGALRRQRPKARDHAGINAPGREIAVSQMLALDEYDLQRIGACASMDRRLEMPPQRSGPAARKRPKDRTGPIDSTGPRGRTVLSLWTVLMLAALLWPGAQEFLPGAVGRLKMLSSGPAVVEAVENSTDVYTDL